MAWAMGRPWLPWQRHAADLIGEQLPSGRYAHPVVVVLVPRQCGKTTFVLDLLTGRCLRRRNYEAAYTAQTGQIASERFRERMAALAHSPLAGLFDTYRSTGKERITATRPQSYVKAFPPIPGALRGSALDAVVVDEAQEVSEDQGRELDQQIIPTFNTKALRQLILIGTAGTDLSGYLRRYLDLARAGHDGFALIEYGFGPDDDPTDETVWWATHPGLAGGLTDVDALRSAQLVMGLDGFAREFGNVWTSSSSRVIGADAWAAAAAPLEQAAGSRVVFGADLAVDRTAGSIVAAWPGSDGRPVLEVVAHRPGTLWVPEQCRDLSVRHGADVWLPKDGPGATILDTLGRPEYRGSTGIPLARVHGVTVRDWASSCAALFDAVTASPPRVLHHADPALDLAVSVAARRPYGEGCAWGRRTAGGDVSPLTAATLALRGFTLPAPAPVRPAVYAA